MGNAGHCTCGCGCLHGLRCADRQGSEALARYLWVYISQNQVRGEVRKKLRLSRWNGSFRRLHEWNWMMTCMINGRAIHFFDNICDHGEAPGRYDRSSAAGWGEIPENRLQSFCDCRRMTFFNAACRDGFRYRSVFPQSSILPSVEMVTTCHGINFPLCCNAVFAACSSPPQQGTSIRTMVTLWMSLLRMISVSFSE